MHRWDRLQSTASSQRWQPGPVCRAPSDKSHGQMPSSGPGELPVALRGSQARHHLTWRASCSTAGTSGAQPSGHEPIVHVCWVLGATPQCTCLFVLSAPPAALSVLPVSGPSSLLHPGPGQVSAPCSATPGTHPATTVAHWAQCLWCDIAT